MMNLSRFVHVFDMGDDSVALYHSLRMKPVYIKKTEYQDILTFLKKSNVENLSDFPLTLSKIATELRDCKILTKDEDSDNNAIKFFRSKIPEPAISGCYFILSEQCNLACKYCFLGNNDTEKRQHFSLKNMSIETAKKGIEFFIRQVEKINLEKFVNDDFKPFIIFYGGEPLLNFEVLDYVASTINDLRLTNKHFKNAIMSVVTNGLLLDVAKLKRLKELNVGVSISIDGYNEKANEMRVDRAGKPTFTDVLKILDMVKENGYEVSLSITLTEESVKDTSKMLELLEKYNVKGYGYNILMPQGEFTVSEDYNKKATQFIIDMFKELRQKGVYEDRMMRKVKTFQNAVTAPRPWFSDCGATAGGQIVIASDGAVGICHGCLWDRKYFVSSVDDDSFDARTNPTYIEWSQLSPINRKECEDCAALGICGGGCPINAMNSKKGNTIHSMDERFCVHSKMTLEFLIKDLYKNIKTLNQ